LISVANRFDSGEIKVKNGGQPVVKQ